MMTIRRALSILLLTVLICGCEDEYATQARLMKKANVNAEVTAALARGDSRFVGVMGYSLVVPGVTNFPTMTDDFKRVRIIPNTSDVILNRAHEHLQEVASDYATRYNLELMRRLEAKTDASNAAQANGATAPQPGR